MLLVLSAASQSVSISGSGSGPRSRADSATLPGRGDRTRCPRPPLFPQSLSPFGPAATRQNDPFRPPGHDNLNDLSVEQALNLRL